MFSESGECGKYVSWGGGGGKSMLEGGLGRIIGSVKLEMGEDLMQCSRMVNTYM